MRYVVLLVRRAGATGYEVFVFPGEADLTTPGARYSPQLGKIVNREEITDDFEMVIRLRESSPLFQRAVAALKLYEIIEREEASA